MSNLNTLLLALKTAQIDAVIVAEKIINFEIDEEKLVYVSDNQLVWTTPAGGVIDMVVSSEPINTFAQAAERAQAIKDFVEETADALSNKVEEIESITKATQELINEYSIKALLEMQSGEGTQSMVDCTKLQNVLDNTIDELTKGRVSRPLNESPVFEALQVAFENHPDVASGVLDLETAIRCLNSAEGILEAILVACIKVASEDLEIEL